MSGFKKGDQVRLKAKPEVVGVVTNPPDASGELELNFKRIRNFRFPEELELAPEPLKVGDRVKHVNGVEGTVVGLFNGYAWVNSDRDIPVTWGLGYLGRI